MDADEVESKKPGSPAAIIGSSGGDNKKPKNRHTTLTQLKYPLSFFGLALLVVEGTFGGALIKGVGSPKTTIVMGALMTGLFLVSIIVVAFLVYKVPTHVMLLPQDHVENILERTSELSAMRKRLKEAAERISKLSEQLPEDPEEIKRSLRELIEIVWY